MVRFSVYLVLLLVSGAALVNGVASDAGYVLVAWGSWQVESEVEPVRGAAMDNAAVAAELKRHREHTVVFLLLFLFLFEQGRGSGGTQCRARWGGLR